MLAGVVRITVSVGRRRADHCRAQFVRRRRCVSMPLPQIHLFEFEDLPWFPRVVRDCATDYLRFIEDTLRLHRPAVVRLMR